MFEHFLKALKIVFKNIIVVTNINHNKAQYFYVKLICSNIFDFIHIILSNIRESVLDNNNLISIYL